MAAPSGFRPPVYPNQPPTGAVAHPPEHWAPAPTPVPANKSRPAAAWAAVVVSMLGVVVGTIAAFAPWAEYVDGVELSGVEHGDGWIVLAIVAAASALVGALAFGARHRAIRYGLLLASAGLFVVFALNRFDISRSDDHVTGGPIDVGGGLYGVPLAACLLLAGALIIPTDKAPRPARA